MRRSTVVPEGQAQVEGERRLAPEPGRKGLLPPRLLGLLSLLFGVGIGWIGLAYMRSGARSIPIAPVAASPALIVLGTWALAIGRPIDPSTGKPPRWYAVGFWIVSAIAAVAGLVAVVAATLSR